MTTSPTPTYCVVYAYPTSPYAQRFKLENGGFVVEKNDIPISGHENEDAAYKTIPPEATFTRWDRRTRGLQGPPSKPVSYQASKTP